MSGKQKGSAFERRICQELSLWWSEGKDSDIFWRTSNSGGRSTSRAKKGKNLEVHAGDVCAIKPEGEPLLKLVAVELKKGYPKSTIHTLLDKPIGAAEQLYERWILQAQESQKQAGSLGWLIIHQRDRRMPIVCLPASLSNQLQLEGAFKLPFSPVFRVSLVIDDTEDVVVLMTLAAFFKSVKPEQVREVIGCSSNSRVRTFKSTKR